MAVDSLRVEYSGVRKNTTFPGLLETTAKIQLTRKSQIIRLLTHLGFYRPLDQGFPSVRFGVRNWARHKENKLSFADPENGHDMTVHIVLHEYAHLWAAVSREKGQQRRRPHGIKFRLCLDALLLLWRDKIREDYMAYLRGENSEYEVARGESAKKPATVPYRIVWVKE